ncbi:MAG: helix-turn-helix domain-containing protein [Nitrospinota bacterium]
MQGNLSLGLKIKQYRERAELSQMELAHRVGKNDAAWVSRIESGRISPKKASLKSIASALELSEREILFLDEANVASHAAILRTSKKFMLSLELTDVLQAAVNEITYDLNLLGTIIDIVRGDKMFAATFTQSWYTELAAKALPKPFHELSVLMAEAEDNYMVRCVREQKVLRCTDMKHIAVPFVSPFISRILASLSTFKSAIIFPLLSLKGESLGALAFAKDYEDDFVYETPVLQAFTEQVSIAIENAKKFETLKKNMEG